METIDAIEKFERSDIILLDGEHFIEKYVDTLRSMNLNNDLNYFTRSGITNYGYTILKCICKVFGLHIVSKIKCHTIGDTQKRYRLCVIDKL